MQHHDYLSKRFSTINKLYDNGLEKLQQLNICVIGIGGVGSWCVEGLVRSGLNNITIIDPDNIAISNTNRQIHALDFNYGKSKVLAMQERIVSINNYCKINIIDDFITTDNIENYLNQYKFHFIIDATDDILAKIAISIFCHKYKIPFVVCGAAGGKTDALALKLDLLSNAQHDKLLAKLRYSLRKAHGYGDKINIKCLFCAQQINPSTCSLPINTNAGFALSCSGYGSSVGITATMGFMLSQYALNILLK